MSKTEHTPGPWKHDTTFHLYEKDRYNSVIAGNGFEDGDNNYHGFTLNGIMTDADAKLIAAAPELLEALEELYNAIDSCVDLRPSLLQKCRTAIKNAKQ